MIVLLAVDLSPERLLIGALLALASLYRGLDKLPVPDAYKAWAKWVMPGGMAFLAALVTEQLAEATQQVSLALRALTGGG